MEENGVIFEDNIMEENIVEYDNNIYNNIVTVITDSMYINDIKNLKEYTMTNAIKYICKEGNTNKKYIPQDRDNKILCFAALWLYKNGGVYIDQKTKINKYIYNNMKKNTDFVLFIDKNKKINKNIIISKPGCNYWLDVYNEIMNNPQKCPSQILWDCLCNKDYKYTLSKIQKNQNCSDTQFYQIMLFIFFVIIIGLLLFVITKQQ